jgi:hypothetical protein
VTREEMEMIEEFGLVNISFFGGGLLRTQSRRWGREEFYMRVEVWIEWSE